MADVWIEYHWECPNCGSEHSLPYMPEFGKKLPKCETCGKSVKCEGITEDVNPKK